MAALLIALGADINADADGDHGQILRPLHCAAMLARPDLVRLLLESGADATTDVALLYGTRGHGYPGAASILVLEHAIEHGSVEPRHFETLELLLGHGLDTNAMTLRPDLESPLASLLLRTLVWRTHMGPF